MKNKIAKNAATLKGKKKIIIIVVTLLAIIVCALVAMNPKGGANSAYFGLSDVEKWKKWIPQLEVFQEESLRINDIEREMDRTINHDTTAKLESELQASIEHGQEIINSIPFKDTSFLNKDFMVEYLENYSAKEFVTDILEVRYTYINKFFRGSEGREEKEALLDSIEVEGAHIFREVVNPETFFVEDFGAEPEGYFKENPDKQPELLNGEIDGKRYETTVRYYGDMAITVTDIFWETKGYSQGRYEWVDGVFYDEPGGSYSKDCHTDEHYLYVKDKKINFYAKEGMEYFLLDNELFYYDIDDDGNEIIGSLESKYH